MTGANAEEGWLQFLVRLRLRAESGKLTYEPSFHMLSVGGVERCASAVASDVTTCRFVGWGYK